MTVRTVRPTRLPLWAAAAALTAIACGCGRTAPPQSAAPTAAAASNKPASANADALAAPAAPRSGLTPEQLPEEPMTLPAGHTLGDLLPQIPKPAPQLGATGGAATSAAAGSSDCGDAAPDGFSVVKRVDVLLDPAHPGEAPATMQGCVLQQVIGDRADRVASSGRRYLAVAVLPDGKRVTGDVGEIERPSTQLPPERRSGGHDATGWASLIATGDPTRPLLLVVTARFWDGPLGEEVHFVRQSRVLGDGPDGWHWRAGPHRAFSIIDFNHLQALCSGSADASAADRAAGAVAAACDRVATQAAEHDAQALARLAIRKKRLGGAAGGDAATDPDPQSIWLRDAKVALAKANWVQAVTLALQVDVVCGEAATEAHKIIADAMAGQKREPIKAQPAQSTTDLCEPLPDKAPPKRQRADKAAVPAKPTPAARPTSPAKVPTMPRGGKAK